MNPNIHISVQSRCIYRYDASVHLLHATPHALQVPRWGHTSVLVNSTVMVMGGTTATTAATNDVRLLQLPTPTSPAQWVRGCFLPANRTRMHAAVVCAPHSADDWCVVHTFGGCDDAPNAPALADHWQFHIPSADALLVCSTPTTNGLVHGVGVKATTVIVREVRHTDTPVKRRSVAAVPTSAFPNLAFIGSAASSLTGALTGQSVFDPTCM